MMENETWMDISSGVAQPSSEDPVIDWDTNKAPSSEPPAPSENSVPEYPIHPPEKPQRVRRVGSFTMGIALIACGILVLLFLLFHNIEMVTTAAKWSPVLLILLGVEILLSNFLFRKERLKYDFLSGFFCLCIVGGSLLISTGSVAYAYGQGRYEAEASISQQISDQCYEQLRDIQDISSLSVQVSLNGAVNDIPQSYQELHPYDYVSIHIRLLGQDGSAQSFAQRCKEITSRLDSGDFSLFTLSFYAGDLSKEQNEYELTIQDRFQKGLSAEHLAELVTVTKPAPQPEEEP